MKKLLLFSALIGFAFFANAQSTTYKAFKVDLDLGYAIPSTGTGTKAGATFTIEPHYRLSDAFALGFRFEGAALGDESNIAGDTKIKASLLISYCATGEYYLSKGGFRPFVGAGVGFFYKESVSGDSNSGNSTGITPGGTNMGYFPRVGFETGHFRMSAAYDVVGNSYNYTAFTIGFFFGGGKK